MSDAEEEEAKPKKGWRYSEAKEMLYQDIVFKKLEGMTPEEVYASREEFNEFKQHLFIKNYSNLVKHIQKKQKTAFDDMLAFIHDSQVWQRPPRAQSKPHWNTHQAKVSLEQDIDGGKTKKGGRNYVESGELYFTRPEYQEFTKEDFLKHVYQATKIRVNKHSRMKGKYPYPTRHFEDETDEGEDEDYDDKVLDSDDDEEEEEEDDIQQLIDNDSDLGGEGYESEYDSDDEDADADEIDDEEAELLLAAI